MQLWINAVNINVLENLESILYSDDKEIAHWFGKNLPGEIYEKLSPQYEFQVMSAMQIRKVLGGNAFKNIKGIYFGTEQCEYLLPTVEETKKAVILFKEFDKKYTTNELKQFVFLTPYFGNAIIRQRMVENFEYLNENAAFINPKTKTVEIIVNDFGTINILKQYSNLKPVMGRLLVKTLKNPIVDTLGIEENVHIAGEQMKNKSPEEIKGLKEHIAQNQKEGFGRSAMNNEYFSKFLGNYDIRRAGIDYQENYPQLFESKIFDQIDVYFPYALIFIGRLCDTSAIENVKRGYYPVDEVCPRTCWKFDMYIKNFQTVGYKLIQRGNAQYKSQINLNLTADTIEKYENRLVYTPLI